MLAAPPASRPGFLTGETGDGGSTLPGNLYLLTGSLGGCYYVLSTSRTRCLCARRSDVMEGLARAIREAIAAQAPEHAHLDPSGWRPLPEALEALPHLDRFYILRQLPCVRTVVGHKGARSVYVWIGEMPPP